MHLPKHKVEYLIKHQNRLSDRGIIIDLMTQVGARPTVFVAPSEMITETKLETTINLFAIPEDMPCLLHIDSTGVKDIESEYGVPDNLYGLVYQYRNYLAANDNIKKQIDDYCKKTYDNDFDTLVKLYRSEKYAILKYNKYSLKPGDVFILACENKAVLVYVDAIEDESIFHLKYLDNGVTRVYGETDTFTLHPGDTPNVTEEMTTTVGRFLLNYILLVRNFGKDIPYINSIVKLSTIDDQVSKGLINKTFTIDQYKSYVDSIFFIGHFTELCVPTYSRKSLTTDPNVAKVKAELMKKYAGRLDEPQVISEIETTLINMDKAYLSDDSAMRFYAPLGDKPFNISRKKMYLTVGGIEAFSKNGGSFVFVPNSLEEGMNAASLPAMANESRKGSFNRGDQTKLGGALTKKIIRILQDLVCTIEDCGTNRGLKIDFSKYKVDRYIGSYIQTSSGSWEVLTEDNKSKYDGKVCIVRSPMYCRAPQGLCRHCMGTIYSQRDTRYLALDAVDITSRFTTDALKAMHGTKLSLLELTDLNEYILK